MFLLAVGMLALAACAAIIFIAFVVKNGSTKGSRFSADSDSYEKTAWKFANVVQSGVLYPVVRDIDGDTIIVDVGGNDVTVRLIGADTPETVDPRKSVQCYGPEASAEAKRIFGEKIGNATSTGISVYLDKDPAKGDYDKYGRLLAYVRLPQDIVPDDAIASTTDLYNEYVIIHGFAHEYTFMNQPYQYQARFKADEAAAKKARVGLWGKCPAGGD